MGYLCAYTILYIGKMKDFMKVTLATMVGMLLFTVVTTVVTIVGLAGILASEGTSMPVEDNSILRIRLSGVMDERTTDNPTNYLLGTDDNGLGLDRLLLAIDRASTSDKVKGIYLEGGPLSASPAMLQELRQALVKFKKSGKFIYAYGDTYTQGSYYVCSVADSLWLNPDGMVDWHGLASQPVFYKEALERLGVKMQVVKVGTFKSAVEPYTCTEMSQANREQVTSYLTSIWQQMVADVAASRRVKPERLNAMADSMAMFRPAGELIKAHMVDRLMYLDEVRDALKTRMKIDADESLCFATPADVAAQDNPKVKDKKVAVYYAYGDIVDEAAANSLLTQSPTISPDVVNPDLQALLDDDDVAAVVLRVNSGGGSAYASEQIWRQVALVREKKPVVVSMGGMAASGGYYISCGANRIFAEPTTLTGSIGIFGMFPDASQLLTEKLGLRYDVVKTNAMGDFGTLSRPMTPAETHLLQAYVDRGYEQFTGRVSQGRRMKLADVKAIAEGRVWTGAQAKERGLVDQLGNLDDAVRCAARLAKVDDYSVARYPVPPTFLEQLLDKAAADDYLETHIRTAMGEYYPLYNVLRTLRTQNPVQARVPYTLCEF